MLDFIGVLLIGLIGFVGWHNGFAIMAARLGGLFVGGVLAAIGYGPVANALTRFAGWQLIPAHVAALLALVGLGLLLGTLAEWSIRRARRPPPVPKTKQGAKPTTTTPARPPRRQPHKQPSTVGRAAGAALGVAWGVSLTLAISWALLMVGGLTDGPPSSFTDSQLGHAAADLAGRVTYEATLRTVNNDALASIAAAVARDPQRGARSLGEVLNNQAVYDVLYDQDVRRRLIEAPTAGGGVAPVGLAPLLEDPALTRKAYEAGIIRSDPSDLDDARVLKELSDGLRPLARTIDVLSNDKEFLAMLDDPVLLERVRSGDLMALANDQRFNWLATRILEELRRN